jgi:cobaltochelatase CobS
MVRKTDVTLPGDYPAPLAAQIPGVAVHQAYVDRAIEGVAFYDLLDYCAANQVNISTVGDTGAGKTMAKRAWCAARGWAYVRIPCNGGFDPDTVFGTTEIIDGETIWTPGLLPLAIEHGRALIDFDEVNFAPPKMMAVFHGLLDDHGVLILNGVAGGTKIIPRHPETLISASWNEDYAGTQPLNEATKDRLGGITVDWPYLRSVEESLVGFDFVAVEGAEAEWRTAHALLDVADKLRMAYR